ncbi:hypothetical protein [Flavobacterium sp.]
MFSFVKGAGKLFEPKEENAPTEEVAQSKASALLAHVQALGLAFKNLKV